MASRLNPYLTFQGNAREAMEFYKTVFGGELAMNTFGEYGSEGPEKDGIMHAQLETELGYVIMGSDAPPGMPFESGSTMAVSLSGDDGDALRGYYERLADGGTVTMPLEKQMWGDEFGMCTDKYGTSWMVNIGAPQTG